jgi:hypothetical protein
MQVSVEMILVYCTFFIACPRDLLQSGKSINKHGSVIYEKTYSIYTF